MESESHSGRDRDEILDPSDDWIASFGDVVFSWTDPAREHEPAHTSGDVRWRADANDEKTSSKPEESSPLVADATAGRSRKRVAIVAAIVVLLVAVGSVGVVALVGRDDGASSSSSGAATPRRESSTTRSPVATSTTIALAPAPSAPSASPVTPSPFTVRSTCAGRNCAVAVRDMPNARARQAGSLRAGDVVQITCSTHGESIQDRDTGQRSDVWYRLGGTSGYSSALYLAGPTVPDCG